MQPKFRAGDFYGGLTDALNAIIKLIDGEPLPAPLDNKRFRNQRCRRGALLPLDAVRARRRARLARRVAIDGARGTDGAAAARLLAWIFTSSIILPCWPRVSAASSDGSALGGGSGWSSGGGWCSGGGGGWSGGSSSGGGGFSGGGGGFAGGGASGSW